MEQTSRAIAVLAVDCPTGSDDTVHTSNVDSIAAALAALRGGSFDLLLTGTQVDGQPVWPLVRKLRTVRPKLWWWLVANGIGPDEERLARSLGLARLLATRPPVDAIRLALSRPSPIRPASGVSEFSPMSL